MDTQSLSSPFGNCIYLLPSCITLSLLFVLLGRTCWPLCVYAVEKVVRLSLLRLQCAVNSSSPGKSNEIGRITLSYPMDRTLFSWCSLFRSGSASVRSHHQDVFHQPAVLWEPSQGHRQVTYSLLSLLLTHRWTLLAALQQFGKRKPRWGEWFVC